MIGLITLNDYSNFGNRLQNYAVWRILSEIDETRNIISFYGSTSKKGIFASESQIDRNLLYQAEQKWAYYHCSLQEFEGKIVWPSYEAERRDNFLSFTGLISQGEMITPDMDYHALSEKYSCFVTGSDQVFNPRIPGNSMFVNMLGFAPAYKRIALAPSVAIQELNETEKAEFKKFLSPFRCLSCREKQGAALITSITSKKCVSLIDPVFMVTRDQWASIEKKPVFHEEKKYILLYFLGNITGEYRMIIDTISKTYGLEVIDLLDTESKYYQSGPAEFIYLIHHCAIILTDSFHGSAFSYIFNKPFRIFRRKDNLLDMNSRLVNLMDILHLDDSIYIGSDVDYDKLFDVHYDQSYFEAEKAAFTEYLKNAFGGV